MEQHPRTGSDRRGQRPEGKIGDPVSEEVGETIVKKPIPGSHVTVVTSWPRVVKFKEAAAESAEAGDSPHNMPFRALNLSPQILLAVRDAGYTEPTPIQVAAIPHILAGDDLIGIAQTGTG